MIDLPTGPKVKHHPGLKHEIENWQQDLVGCPVPEPSLIDPFHSSEARGYQSCGPLGPNGHCFVMNWNSVCLAVMMTFSLPFSFISGSRSIRSYLLNPYSSHPTPDVILLSSIVCLNVTPEPILPMSVNQMDFFA